VIPGAEYALVPGVGRAIQENDFALEAIEAFFVGSPARRIPDTVLATILFTDLVGSTVQTVELGDREWRSLLERHNDLVRIELARFRGVEIDTTGDGFFASFDGPARAIACAREIVDRMPELGLEARAGIHKASASVWEASSPAWQSTSAPGCPRLPEHARCSSRRP